MQVEYASFIAILCSGIIAIVYSYLALDYYISEFPSEEDKEIKNYVYRYCYSDIYDAFACPVFFVSAF